jgi:choline dehydrogenase
MHLTDHLSGSIVYSTSAEITGDLYNGNATYDAEQLALWKAGDPSSILNSPNDAIAYVNLTTLFGAGPAATLLAGIRANQSSQVTAYSTNSLVQAGYNATYSAELADVFSSPIGQAEILMANTGSYGKYASSGNTISIQAAIQHPLSRGSVKITTTSTFDAPTIDPGYLTHPADIQILRESFKFARKVGQSAPLASILLEELAPGPAVSTDAEWETWIRSVVSTEYHPASSCTMMPLAFGGVVDEEMRVHGTQNLRVVDSSIVPIGMSAHMTSPLYGFAENAYDIMMNPPSLAATTTGSSSNSSSSSSTSTSSANSSTSPTSSSSSTPLKAGSNLSVKSRTILSSVASLAIFFILG